MGCGKGSKEVAPMKKEYSLSGHREEIKKQAREQAKARATYQEEAVKSAKFKGNWMQVLPSLSGRRKGKEKPAEPGGPEKEPSAKDKNREHQAKLQFLAAVPLMKRLPKSQHPLVANVMCMENFDVGQDIIRQGDLGDAFYIIRKGEARVHVVDEQGDEKWLSVLKAGDFFGENALLRDEPRMASVYAETALQTFTIKRDEFQELGLNAKLQFANRRAVVGGTSRPAKAKDPTPKSPDDYRLIAKALKMNKNLETMIEFADDRVKGLIDVMWSEDAAEGQEIITKDQLDADYFYIVQDGLFEVFGEDGERSGELKRLTTIGAGGSFGELALLYLTPRAATVVCKEEGRLWVIDRSHFKKIMLQASGETVKRYMGYLDRVTMLDPLTRVEKEELAQGLVEMYFTQGEDIIEEGDLGSTFYIMYDGTVQVIKEGVEVEMLSAEEGHTTQFFGEKALLESEKRAATVRVQSPTAKLLGIDRETFMVMLGPLKDLIEKGEQRKTRAVTRYGRRYSDASQSSALHGNIKLRDLQKVALMAYGSYSKVELWEHKTTAETYALKRISRWHINNAGTQESIWCEKEVLMGCDSPFIVKCFETYASKISLCFLLEACLGGDLHNVYCAKGLYGSAKCARYYTAASIFALEHMHERRALYRDLKPENMMLTRRGHLKLTDFGLSKFVVGKTYTTCGTPDYFAPEMIHSQGHTRAVDWWAFGILIFELMCGHPPFSDMNPLEIYNKVVKGIEKVSFPAKCQGQAEQLVLQLLRPNPSERLPMRKGGIENMKTHKWYDGFEWDSLEDETMTPPYIPVVSNNKDLHHFKPDPADYLPQADGEHEETDDSWTEGFATA